MDIRICERDTKPVIKKKNVYITGHAKDVFRFETIAEEILSLLDCKVYINNTVQFDEKIEEHLFFLAEMDVIVVAVTKSFLTEDNPARDIEFEFIKEKKIPVLPILLEENFEHVFDSVCGNWQLLNRRSVDYKKKLEEYLNFIFGDDELHASVQNVLTGEVFLSYRKKERKHVLQLMHMIHEFDTCEDLKIWYDDFLTLGEKYDEEIDYHLKKSDIFVLVVTPSLLEESNYVMEIEYPRAISLKKRIIPIELIPTDKEMLLRKYPQLPECINVRDVQTLENVFMEAKNELKLKSCPVSDERDYLLGQAYFKGISVELNRERGIVLMTKAAENGHIKAIYQLAAIYYEGKGLEKNLPEAQRWLEKDVELCRKGFEEDALKWGNTLAISMLNLSDCYYNLNNLVAAKETLTQLVDVTIWLWNEGFMGTGSNPGNVWLRLGMLCMSEDDYNGAIQYYNKAEEFLRDIYQCSETTQSTKSYALILGEQGEVYYQLFCKTRNVSCLYKAIHYFEKAKQIQERYIEVYKQNDGIQNLTSIYTNLSNAYCNLNTIEQNPDEMLVYLEKAREHFWHVYMQKQISPVERLDSLYLYATYTNTVGFLRESQGEIEYARRLYAEAYNIYKDMCEQRGDEEHYFGLATASIQLAVAGMEIPDKELLMEAYTILKMLCQKYPENKEYIKYLNSTLSRIQSWPKNLG